MKIASLSAIPVSVPYRTRETSAIIDRGGVSDVIVKITTDTGLVGWAKHAKRPTRWSSSAAYRRANHSSWGAIHGTTS